MYSQTSVVFPCHTYNASLVPEEGHCSVPCPRADIYTFSLATNYESCPYRGSDTMILDTTLLRKSGLIRATEGNDNFFSPATSWTALESDVSDGDSLRIPRLSCVW